MNQIDLFRTLPYSTCCAPSSPRVPRTTSALRWVRPLLFWSNSSPNWPRSCLKRRPVPSPSLNWSNVASSRHSPTSSLASHWLSLCLSLSRMCIGAMKPAWSSCSTSARHLTSHRILLVLTYRSEEVDAAFTPFLAGLDRERLTTELTLTPLTNEEVEAMIRTIFLLPHALPADFLTPIYRLTEGNPFFIEEILKSLVNAGEIVYSEGRWKRKPSQSESLQVLSLSDRVPLPRSVQLAVQQRLDDLSAEARDLLSLAAVTGRRFDFTLLQQVARRDEAELVHLVKELISAQLIVEEAEDEFAFRHALTRQAVYTDLLSRERRALHLLVAETLERISAGTIDAHLDDLSYHFYAARGMGQSAGVRATCWRESAGPVCVPCCHRTVYTCSRSSAAPRADPSTSACIEHADSVMSCSVILRQARPGLPVGIRSGTCCAGSCWGMAEPL